MEALVRSIFNKKLKVTDIDEALWNHNYTYFNKAITDAYKGSKIKYGTADYAKIAQLKKNTAVFAAFKSNAEIREAHKLLLDAEGKARTWKEFKTVALKVSEKYNVRWLQTEFNQAHQSATMARRWNEAEANADLYPNLKYVAVDDSHTRLDHKELDGIIKPINDPFWDIYYPPNGWGCRCSAQPTDAGTTKDKKVSALPDDFKNNPGKSDQIFTKKHPYFNGTKGIQKKGEDLFAKKK